jgi:hypothetical protein
MLIHIGVVSTSDSMNTIFFLPLTTLNPADALEHVNPSTHMRRLPTLGHAGAEVAAHSPLEHLKKVREERACEGGVPPAFGRFIADERVLGLYLEELVFSKKARAVSVSES